MTVENTVSIRFRPLIGDSFVNWITGQAGEFKEVPFPFPNRGKLL
jgi:hypothetical protein